MKTYTFKIKVDFDKVVCAVNMQLEQFFESVKMTKLTLGELVARYPHAYITACDYHVDDDFIDKDFCLSTLRCLLDSGSFKSYLTSSEFFGFVGDNDFNSSCSAEAVDKARDYILSLEDVDEEVKENVELSENDKK